MYGSSSIKQLYKMIGTIENWTVGESLKCKLDCDAGTFTITGKSTDITVGDLINAEVCQFFLNTSF